MATKVFIHHLYVNLPQISFRYITVTTKLPHDTLGIVIDGSRLSFSDKGKKSGDGTSYLDSYMVLQVRI